MSQTIKLKDKTYSGVDGVGLPLVGGGEAIFVDPSGTDVSESDVLAPKTFVLPDGSIGTGSKIISPFGDDATLLATYDMGTTKLSNTDFATWTPSTTAKSIKATSNLGTQVLDLENYEYMLVWLFESNTAYASGTTRKAAPVRQIYELAQSIYRKPSNLTNLGAANDNCNYCTTLCTAPLIDYYNASGTHTISWSSGYGIYPSLTAAAFSSTSSKTPTLTIKAPAYYARCSTTYFATGMASAVDQENSTIKCVGRLYRVNKRALLSAMFHDVVEKYNS